MGVGTRLPTGFGGGMGTFSTLARIARSFTRISGFGRKEVK